MNAEMAIALETLKTQLKAIPRRSLCHLPTPVEKLENLSRILKLNLYVKRDDQTGLALGGNKARKLEFILPDAMAQGADSLITWAGVQSNWCRQAAAAARRVGIAPILILFKRPGLPAERDGNLLLDEICGADTTIVEVPRDAPIGELQQVRRFVDPVVERVRGAGRNPYVVPIGGSLPEGSMSRPLGALGYVNGMFELAEQGKEQELALDYLVFATSSGGTHAGLLVGAKLLALGTKIVGISVADKQEKIKDLVTRIGNQTLQEFASKDPELRIDRDEVIALDEYVGPGYGVLSQSIVKAIQLVAENEGVLLDPVYTGKAMAGLLDLCRHNYFERGKNVLFLHTGGMPALFPYREGILKCLGSSSTLKRLIS